MKIKSHFQLTIITYFISILTITLCVNANNNSQHVLKNILDTLKELNMQHQSVPKCRPFDLSYLELIGRDKLHKLKVLSPKEFQSYQIEAIDAFYDDLYKYHFVDSVCMSANYTLLLIAREYANENIIWLCTYDKNNKLTNTKQVFYDNAEGNFQIESKLVSNLLTLQTDDVNEGKRQEKYKISGDLKLVKIK